ncbi:F-box/kelch-repeat protein At3g23880-like [Nicotiana sylvestris]|uniref:F-box/kelch-repeat protein At3g23880-like n=1 Tax=Nicotiana sylvestris TaxID=4096 RepID=A0A1U7VB59_NICSY|nr:PREDICTED: F-box/kelch-repeat protein At3g23880-like [Nicotiana sylvestris]
MEKRGKKRENIYILKEAMNLPEDVIFEILIRLPVTSLVRFKCVCKSWYSLIENPNLISKHLHNLSSRKNYVRLLISRRGNITNKRVVSLSMNDTFDVFINQDFPSYFNDKFGHVRLIGPCNGIVCLCGYPDNIVIWNPSIRDYKILPQSQIQRLVGSTVRGSDFGLGFDSKRNDYKVIQILFCLSNDRVVVYQVEIYSLNENIWRKYNGIVPAKIKYGNISWSMIYKNEIFCWLAQNGDNNEVILSFNMSEEIFENTPLPSNIGVFGEQEIRNIWVILPLNESISLIVYCLKQVEKYFDIWVINELGVKNCWTKLQRIGPLSRVERPLGFWKNGEFILENSNGQLVIYDPVNQEVKTLGFYGKRDRLELVVYKESLVSVN